MRTPRIEFLSWALLCSIFIATYFTHTQLHDIKAAILKGHANLPKMQLLDNEQFEQIASQLSSQWNAQGYAIYILQPKSDLKTHKEKAVSNIETFIDLPIRSTLSDVDVFRKFKNDKYAVIDSTNINLFLTKAELNHTTKLIALPIYKYNIIVAEMYIKYDISNIPSENDIQKFVLEAQVLSQLLY